MTRDPFNLAVSAILSLVFHSIWPAVAVLSALSHSIRPALAIHWVASRPS
jgi:uncharacterized membrane protein